MEIITKTNERIDWQKKIASLSPVDARKWQVQEYRRVQEDKAYWFKNYVWTIDAREDPAIVPFILYPYQEDLIKQLDKFMDTFIDKSRQMGISWTLMGWQLHHALYKTGFTSLNISRKESEVQDSGNTHHCLFGRLNFIHSRLPPFLKPAIHNPFLTFKVPSKNSIIKGESSNPRAGRDSQYKFILIDEAAHIDCLDEMWKGVRSASNSICLNSTPPQNKLNNKFAEIRDLKNSGFVKMRFHWSQHPKYTQEWYAKKTASMTPQEIAQELEMSYDGALVKTSYAEYSDNVHLCGHKIYLNPKAKLYCFMDFGLGGEVFLFAQVDSKDRIFFIHYSIFKDKLTPELYLEFLRCLGKIGYTGEIKDIIFVGDKSGTKRSRTSKTNVIDEYRTVSQGAINIRYKSDLSNEEKMKDMKACLKRRIENYAQFNISREESCMKFAEAMRCIQLNKTGDDHVDNDYTHVVNAAEYGISYLFPRKKADVVVISFDPSNDRNPSLMHDTAKNLHQTHGSAANVVSSYRIPRKGVIVQ
jgi:hypothetical protein